MSIGHSSERRNHALLIFLLEKIRLPILMHHF